MKEIVIAPKQGWRFLDLREIFEYRELFWFLMKRDLQVRYRQTILGGSWAILQPFLTMIVFSVFFGRMAKMPSDGVPYPIFVYVGLLPWTYFANALTQSSGSVVNNRNYVTKIYFPRAILPSASTLAALVDFAVAMLVLGGLMVWYGVYPDIHILVFPVLLLAVFLCAVGMGLWLSALNVVYRDVKHVIPFLIQMWMFVSPVIYPVNIVDDRYKWILALNPMTGIIKGCRASFLSTVPMDWNLVAISLTMVVALFISGVIFFARMEGRFADVI
ncbi:MAG: ABC transporter permease [Desulfatibacillaceae bacterium]